MEIDQRQVSSSSMLYAVVNNIPSFYRSADLRRFFSQFVETGGFDCFHFRHRPEKQSVKTSSHLEETISTSGNNSETSLVSHSTKHTQRETFCCIIRMLEVKFVELTRTYHQRNWQDSKGESVASKCLISRLKTLPSESLDAEKSTDTTSTRSETVSKYQTRGEMRKIPSDREEFCEEDILQLPELRPPTVMPQGNVGTPTMHFMKLIQECQLPPSIIKKLQLDFPKSRSKGKYGSVPFDYKTEVAETTSGDDAVTSEDTPSEHNHELDSVSPEESACVRNTADNVGNSADGVEYSADSVRNSADNVGNSADSVRNSADSVGNSADNVGNSADSGGLPQNVSDSDPVTQRVEPKPTETRPHSTDNALDYKEKRRLKKLAKRERRKLMAERIEEKMIEFEKGGSDSGDDNDTCEEWERHEAMYDDVSNQGRNKDRLFEEEMEVVWEKGGSGLVFYTDAQYWQEKEGDFDEQTADDLDVDMSAYYEAGAGDKDIRDFLTVRQEQRRRRGLEKTDRFSAGIGKFEQHTKGVGRKILEKQGWTEGSGLGSSVQGIADALDNEGQHPKDRKGLGYRGEKLVKYGTSAQRKRKTNSDVLISTIYDHPDDTDPLEPLKRRNDPSHIKHRDRIN